MPAFRIALAGAIAALAAPAAALATNADGATPTATPLLVELAVTVLIVAGLVARRRVVRLARAAASRLAPRKPIRRQPHGRASTSSDRRHGHCSPNRAPSCP